MTGFTFFCGNLALNDHLGSDPGVVSTDLPQGVFALHALIADHGIHDGLLEGVTHMQTAVTFGGGIMMQKLSWLSSPLGLK